MAVRGHRHHAWESVALLDHDLMSDASTRRIEIYTHLGCELFDAGIFLEVGLAVVLDIVIQREHRLAGIRHRSGPYALELAHDGAGVVMGENVSRLDGDIVTALDLFSFR